MSPYAHIKRCLEVSDRDITSAIAERHLVKALLDQLARISKPGDGAPKLLLVFAKIAGQEADWIDGALRVELAANGEATVVDVLTELGAGMSERVFPSFKMSVPLDEFARAVERVPHMIAPLSVASASAGRLVLTAGSGGEDDASDDVSVDVAIADESMYAGEKRTSSKGKAASSRPRSGKTLRPASPTAAPRSPPLVVPRPPGLPRAEARAAEEAGAPASKRSVVARVPLSRIEVPRAVTRGSRPPPEPAARPAGPALKRASKPPTKRASVKPPSLPKRTSTRPPPAAKAGAKAPPRAPSVRPPRTAAPARAASEPPDEEGVDTGWDDES